MPLPEVAAWSLLAVIGALCTNRLHAAGWIGGDAQRNGFNVYALTTILAVAAASWRARARWHVLHYGVFGVIIGDQVSALISPFLTASASAQTTGFALCTLLGLALLASRVQRAHPRAHTRRIRFVHIASYCL